MTARLLAAMRLASPSLPIGAFAYSQGLEPAVESGWVSDRRSAEAWIVGLLEHALARFDLPLLARLWQACEADDAESFSGYDAWVLAGRGSAELLAEEQHLGAALARLQAQTGESGSSAPATSQSYLAAFAVAAWASGLGPDETLCSFAYAWLEHQVSAAVRLVPLGQTDGHGILLAGLRSVPGQLEVARALPDERIGTSTPGLAIASAMHETQHTRLFRS